MITIQLCDEKGRKPARLQQKINDNCKVPGDVAAKFFALNCRKKHQKNGDVARVLDRVGRKTR